VLIENPSKAALRPYHKQKLALVIANLRHFALEQAARGFYVEHVIAKGSYADALKEVIARRGPLTMMEPAERELREELRGVVEFTPHEGWLTSREDLGEPPWKMERFYRKVRLKTGILMEGEEPLGGQFNFDEENRKPWRGAPPAPQPPAFAPDEITREVGELIATRYAHHPGELHLDSLPATKDDAAALWKWARRECLPNFGPYEDAMSTRSTGLFHSRISPLLNLQRLLPKQVIRDVLALDIPLPSKEGFIRQILGWREYMHWIHVATDGFRRGAEVADRPGDGGYARWAGKSWGSKSGQGGSLTSYLGSAEPLPRAYWGEKSGLNCLDTVVESVWREAWSHHITRLMVLSNLALLLETSPRELTDWFWVAYCDAYDWVVEPNVHGMGTFGLGPLFMTKPYVASAAYINRMSDYCGGCQFDPKKDCPVTHWYWAFLARHEKELRKNPRMHNSYLGFAKRSAEQKREDGLVFLRWREKL
jgi:deoxyribodipyrimidine photolyase-related protein